MSIKIKYRIAVLACLSSVFLSACDGYTTKNGMPAYHRGLSDESSGFTAIIQNADPNTFQVLKDKNYARDKNNVYFRGKIIHEAHPASFVVVADNYGKDDIHGFYEDEIISGADGKMLQEIPGGWVRDNHDVYAGTRAINACDAASFKNLEFDWHADSLCVYNGEKKILGVDIKTFKVVNRNYAKDNQHVYSLVTTRANPNGVIAGADPDSFHAENLCEVCARDKNHCYVDLAIKDCK